MLDFVGGLSICGGVRGSCTRDIVSPARGLHTHNRPRKGGHPRGRARAHCGHNYNTLVNMDSNNDIVWNWGTIAHKDVDDLQENENIANQGTLSIHRDGRFKGTNEQCPVIHRFRQTIFD